MTQMADWFRSRNTNFLNTYMHADVIYSCTVSGTSNPMKGVSGSIFEGKEFSTADASLHYLSRPCGVKTTGLKLWVHLPMI